MLNFAAECVTLSLLLTLVWSKQFAVKYLESVFLSRSLTLTGGKHIPLHSYVLISATVYLKVLIKWKIF